MVHLKVAWVADSIYEDSKVARTCRFLRTPSFASFSRKLWHHLYYHSASPHSYCHPCRASPPSAVPASLNSSARATQPATIATKVGVSQSSVARMHSVVPALQPPSPTGRPHLLDKHDERYILRLNTTGVVRALNRKSCPDWIGTKCIQSLKKRVSFGKGQERSGQQTKMEVIRYG